MSTADRIANLFPGLESDEKGAPAGRGRANRKTNGYEPPNLGKAIRLPVPDFGDPNRPPVCLEVDFPIAPINALSNLEGNAGKPIYQMSKWWARRRSSVFRSLLIAAATQAPRDPTQAAKLVWDHYYCNHQKAGSFRKLRVLDLFMGGGTTLVEGSRLGFQVTGVDLNPVAWFVVKNELSCSDPEQVRALFDHIEAEVKPLIQPFYTTTCPRAHAGRWVDVETGATVSVDPIALPPEERKRYRWEGPEIIYTFWAKHGPCQTPDCGHRTPIFKTPVVAEKKLTAYYIETTCSSCGCVFNAELGETRMAPGTERVVLDNEPRFTEMGQEFARVFGYYSKGDATAKRERVVRLLSLVDHEPGLQCPACGSFAGGQVKKTLESHSRARRVGDLKKSDFEIRSRHTYMYLLIHPDWLKGDAGSDDGGELGGYAGADPEATARWFEKRLQRMRLVEVRGRVKLSDEEPAPEDDDAERIEELDGEVEVKVEADRRQYGLPREVVLVDGARIDTRAGTVPRKTHFSCAACGRPWDILSALRPTGKTAPTAAYALHCHCPECQEEGYSYGGRYFKAPDERDMERLARAEREWAERREADLANWWPRGQIPYSMSAHVEHPLPGHGYAHWSDMFLTRQLLCHAQLIRAVTSAAEGGWSLDVHEQVLGGLIQCLNFINAFSTFNVQRDHNNQLFANNNFNPKANFVDVYPFGVLGNGAFRSARQNVTEGVSWVGHPAEIAVEPDPEGAGTRSVRVPTGDPVLAGTSICCGSSTNLVGLGDSAFDLVITDPPFNNRIYYADLSDFFYVWLRLPLLRWYCDIPERSLFVSERTPHAMEAQRNPAEYPDDREEWEKDQLVTRKHQDTIRALSGDTGLNERDRNPLYRSDPASQSCRQILTACWCEAHRLLRPGGLMAFTFHHSEDEAWVDVLESLFDAGFLLIAAYPVRSDETKGERAQFGSQKIEYDIIHVCRKRVEQPSPVAWARMRRWVRDETEQLRSLLEHSHGRELPESDLRVILRGKALEFYSRLYGQVLTGDGEVLSVRDALLGINQLLDDLLQSNGDGLRLRPPEAAEPISRLFLRVFQDRSAIARDDLHKRLRGTGVAQSDLEARGWVRVVGTTAHAVPISERFQYFTTPGRTRKVLKTDLDQAHFLIAAAQPSSGVNVTSDLDRRTLQVKRSTDAILEWYAQADQSQDVRQAARLAFDLLTHWRTKPGKPEPVQVSLFDQLEAEEA